MLIIDRHFQDQQYDCRSNQLHGVILYSNGIHELTCSKGAKVKSSHPKALHTAKSYYTSEEALEIIHFGLYTL